MNDNDGHALHHTPLQEVVDDHDRAGFDGQFRAELDGMIRCLTCNTSFPAAAERADQVTRLEGPSDPSEMSIVIPLACPTCGTTGTLIANYGPEASEEEAGVLTAIERTPKEGSAADA